MSEDLAALNRTYHEAQGQMGLLPNYYAWTYGKVRPHVRGTVVELGCGAGLGISSYIDRADKVYAVDHDDRLLDAVREAHPGDKVTALEIDLSAEWSALEGVEADLVIMMDILEHFEDDATFLRRVAAIMRPGGAAVVKVPAGAHMYSAVDRASGHYRRYDRADLVEVARQAGLTLKRVHDLNRVGALAYRFKRHESTNFSRTFSAWQLRLINLGMPAIALVDALPLGPGLSLLAVFVREP